MISPSSNADQLPRTLLFPAGLSCESPGVSFWCNPNERQPKNNHSVLFEDDWSFELEETGRDRGKRIFTTGSLSESGRLKILRLIYRIARKVVWLEILGAAHCLKLETGLASDDGCAT